MSDAPAPTRTLADSRWGKSRCIERRILIEGELELETPAHFGNGDASVLTDMPLLLDSFDGSALLTGPSLAGALRSHLRSREVGFRSATKKRGLAELLFGYVDGPKSEQSFLIVDDARSAGRPATEVRDGVALNAARRSAEDKKKYDIQLLEAGTRFPLRLELLVPAGKDADLRRALAAALEGLEDGSIRLGMRKHRGFGKCIVNRWRVREYDLTDPKGLIAWLEEDAAAHPPTAIREATHIAEALAGGGQSAISTASLAACESFTLHATFHLPMSLLIRSGGFEPKAPDMVHLHSKRNGRDAPVLSGTAVAGALRARALRIAQTVGNTERASKLVNDLFGKRIEDHTDKPVAGRIWVEETEVRNPIERVVQRVKIDRFTGGSFPTALFSQQPIFGDDTETGQKTKVELHLSVQNPLGHDIGLLLLLLKDLWTEDLPLGGEASVGRGRLQGQVATLEHRVPPAEKGGAPVITKWCIERTEGKDGDSLKISAGDLPLTDAEAVEALQPFVTAFVTAVQSIPVNGESSAKEADGG